MRGKRAKKRRKVFNIYNLLVLVCIAIIGGSVYVLLERSGIDLREYPPISYVVEWAENLGKEKEGSQNQNQNTNETTQKPNSNTSNQNTSSTNTTGNNVENKPYVIDPGVNSLDEVTEEKAKEIAIKQFEVLGEKDLQADSLECIKIKRDDQLYYYISSANNTIEIKIDGGVITRINSELVSK